MLESTVDSEVALETQEETPRQEPLVETGALALSLDDFSALEERVRRTVDLVKKERQARAAAEERAESAEAKVLAQAAQVEHMQGEVSALRGERDDVRQRVERLLKQLDALEL